MEKILLASNNQGKLREFREILGGEYEILSFSDLGIKLEVEEDGKTFFDNALKKAAAASQASGISAIADDSGLMCEALFGAPGVYSARYSGEHATDRANNEKLLAELKDEKNRRAKFVSSVVLYRTDGSFAFGYGEVEGEITERDEGSHRFGFGYDPIFYSYELKKTFGEASDEEKNTVSHRARAIKDLKSKL